MCREREEREREKTLCKQASKRASNRRERERQSSAVCAEEDAREGGSSSLPLPATRSSPCLLGPHGADDAGMGQGPAAGSHNRVRAQADCRKHAVTLLEGWLPTVFAGAAWCHWRENL